ncbi:MAG: hypothetical protein KC657_37285 [Myxococcales bacterium]|nr:hypothetical protein [Myxococcales bacterium]
MATVLARSLSVFVAATAAAACSGSSTPGYAPIPNGGVTGPSADCAAAPPTPRDAVPTGAAAPRFVGRFTPPTEVQVAIACQPGTDRVTDVERVTGRVFELAGSEIRFRFEGASAVVGLALTEEATSSSVSFVDRGVQFTVTIDDQPPFVIQARPCRLSYDLETLAQAAGAKLGPGVHDVVFHRNSEPLFGSTVFVDLSPKGGKLLPPLERKRRIEVIGDSVACGYGNLGSDAACAVSASNSNAYQAYPAIAARALGAELVNVCWSGKGMYQNFTDGRAPAQGDASPMPALWRRTLLSKAEGGMWDFSKAPAPEAVVIDLGANDVARDNDLDGRPDGFDRARVTDETSRLLVAVREVYPQAHVFVALSPLLTNERPVPGGRSALRDALRAAVDAKNGAGDARVYFMELVEKGERDSDGCEHQPNLEVHRIMAEQLVGAIRSKTCW